MIFFIRKLYHYRAWDEQGIAPVIRRGPGLPDETQLLLSVIVRSADSLTATRWSD